MINQGCLMFFLLSVAAGSAATFEAVESVPDVPADPADPCVPSPCSTGAECRATRESVVCICPADSEIDPSIGCTAGPCSTNPCGDNAVCEKQGNNAVCKCLDGHTGDPF